VLAMVGGVISPAHLVPGQPFLTHAFFCALAAGCFLTYFIKLVTGRPQAAATGLPSERLRLLQGAGLVGLLAASVLSLGDLAQRNGPVIRLTNQTLPDDFRRRVLAELPPGPKVLLADDSTLMNLVRLESLGTPAGQEAIYLDGSMAPWVDYHRHQMAAYPQAWQDSFLKATNHGKMPPAMLDRLLRDLAADRKVFYLQPSVVNPFDHFQMWNDGFVYPLALRPTNGVARAEPDAATAARNDRAWQEFDEQLLPRLTNMERTIQMHMDMDIHAGKLARLFLHQNTFNVTGSYFAHYYSAAEDARGVELQLAGRWAEAARAFNHAISLNPNNISAQVNLAFNTNRETAGDTNNSIAASLNIGSFRTLEQAVAMCGPMDEPYHRIMLGNDCAKSKQPFHAMDQFQRAYELQPGNWGVKLWLASLNLMVGRPAESLATIRELRQLMSTNNYLTNITANLYVLEAQAHLALKDKAAAQAALAQAIDAAHDDSKMMADALEALWKAGLKNEARELMDGLVQDHPDSLPIRTMRGLLFIQAGQMSEADRDFSHVLAQNPKDQMVLFKRGFVRVQLKQFAAARADFQAMLNNSTNAYPAHYALAQVCQAQNDSAGAKRELEHYLDLAPTNAADYHLAVEQLQKLSEPEPAPTGQFLH